MNTILYDTESKDASGVRYTIAQLRLDNHKVADLNDLTHPTNLAERNAELYGNDLKMLMMSGILVHS